MITDSLPANALDLVFMPKRVLAVVAFALVSAVVAAFFRADPTLFAYAAVVVVTLVHVLRGRYCAAFRIRKSDVVVTAIGLIITSLALLAQYVVPLCVGSCSTSGE